MQGSKNWPHVNQPGIEAASNWNLESFMLFEDCADKVAQWQKGTLVYMFKVKTIAVPIASGDGKMIIWVNCFFAVESLSDLICRAKQRMMYKQIDSKSLRDEQEFLSLVNSSLHAVGADQMHFPAQSPVQTFRSHVSNILFSEKTDFSFRRKCLSWLPSASSPSHWSQKFLKQNSRCLFLFGFCFCVLSRMDFEVSFLYI